MAVITINHIKRRGSGPLSMGDEERTEVAGEIRLDKGGRQNVPVGSFKLNAMSDIIFTPKSHAFDMSGSISSPNVYGGRVVNIRPTYSGTTGTRLASIARLGSVVGAGTNSSAYFIAHGY